MSNRRVRWIVAALLVGWLGVFWASVSRAEGSDVTLTRVRGSVGSSIGTPQSPRAVYSSLAMPENSFALTGDHALAILSFPGRSQVLMGSQTTVKIGAPRQALGALGEDLALRSGAVRLFVARSIGTKANYVLTTRFTHIAVRGTLEGIVLAVLSEQERDLVLCIACGNGDVAVDGTAGATVSPKNDEALGISADGSIKGMRASDATAAFLAAGHDAALTGTGVPGPHRAFCNDSAKGFVKERPRAPKLGSATS